MLSRLLTSRTTYSSVKSNTTIIPWQQLINNKIQKLPQPPTTWSSFPLLYSQQTRGISSTPVLAFSSAAAAAAAALAKPHINIGTIGHVDHGSKYLFTVE
jgi:hypothetical protein